MEDFIWYEKYRQKDIDCLSLPEIVKKKFKRYIKKGSIPHLLFIGPPGGGKTTTARILVDNCARKHLILNGSSADRGVETVKTKIKQFAKSNWGGDKQNIVFIDEMDGMTIDAQRALKSTIENSYSNCRFLFTTNELHKIDDAIISRCTNVFFNSIPKDQIMEYCVDILEKEKIKHSEKQVATIIDEFYPDIRSILNTLEFYSNNGKLHFESIIHNIDFKQLTKDIVKGNLGKIRKSWAGMYDFNWMYKFLMNTFLQEVKSKDKGDVAVSIGSWFSRDAVIVDKEINAAACLADIMVILETEVSI